MACSTETLIHRMQLFLLWKWRFPVESCSYLKCFCLTAGPQATFVIQIPDENYLFMVKFSKNRECWTEKGDILFMCACLFICNANSYVDWKLQRRISWMLKHQLYLPCWSRFLLNLQLQDRVVWVFQQHSSCYRDLFLLLLPKKHLSSTQSIQTSNNLPHIGSLPFWFCMKVFSVF